MKSFVKKILRKPYRIIRAIIKINWIKTLRINFSLLPFCQAIMLPVVVIGKLKIDSIAGGNIAFDCPIKYGLVIIGQCVDNMPIELSSTRLKINGTLIFKGHCIINHSANVVVWTNSKMVIGNFVIIASGVLLKSACSITIGDYTRLASGCFVMDTNVHCIKDVVTGKVNRIMKPIEIGKCCWLTMNTSVTAGAKIPDYSVSTRGAILNKDYTLNGELGCMLTGSPAKILKTNIQRIFDTREESKIIEYFHDNPDADFYQSKPGFESLDDIDVRVNFII